MYFDWRNVSPSFDQEKQNVMSKIWKTGPTKAFKFIKPIVHVGFVPLIIYIALKQEPNLTLWQIINPLAAPSEPAQMQ